MSKEIDKVIHQRRAVYPKYYSDETISKKTILQILENALWYFFTKFNLSSSDLNLGLNWKYLTGIMSVILSNIVVLKECVSIGGEIR